MSFEANVKGQMDDDGWRTESDHYISAWVFGSGELKSSFSYLLKKMVYDILFELSARLKIRVS